MRWAAVPAMLLPIALGPGAVQDEPARPAVPLEPVAALLDALESHDVVALGDPHGDERAHAFRLALIRDAQLVAAVDDIVVEWGNALYQDVIDQYVNGADVSLEDLRPAWQNTTQPTNLAWCPNHWPNRPA